MDGKKLAKRKYRELGKQNKKGKMGGAIWDKWGVDGSEKW